MSIRREPAPLKDLVIRGVGQSKVGTWVKLTSAPTNGFDFTVDALALGLQRRQAGFGVNVGPGQLLNHGGQPAFCRRAARL
jgi:hypothetical protein